MLKCTYQYCKLFSSILIGEVINLVCPKCGKPIGTFDLKPNCKHCGVNIMYYTQEADLARDAKRAELEFASARIVVAKIKATFIGGALPIARLVLILLCIGALVLPFAEINYAMPAVDDTWAAIGGLGLYNMYNNGMLMLMPDFLRSSMFGTLTVKAFIFAGLFVEVLLLHLANLVIEILSFLNIKKSAKAMSTISFIAAGICAAAQIASLVMSSDQNVNYGFGAAIAAVTSIIFGILNLKIYNKDIDLGIKENDYLRKDMLRKVKAGEVYLDDLTLPVFESEEEKEKRLAEFEEALKAEAEGKLDD